ncbi:MAG: PhzF family phenazine biosynthesis protein [Candidatus Binataceae bacterium]
MPSRIAFTMVDVFTSLPFGGNHLAVFHNAGRLTAAQMQSLSHEMNFSESTFVIPPARRADPVRVRIFTPRREIPMAGHPTVGTAWVMATRGEVPIGDATLRLGIGDVKVTIEGRAKNPRFVWMAHRAAEFGERRSDRAQIARARGIRPDDIRSDLPIQVVSTGNPFLFIPLRSTDALTRCVSSESALREMFRGAKPMLPVHMFVCGRPLASGVRARMFAPHTDGIVEDPATGSAAAPLGAYLAAHGVADAARRVRFEVIQGVEMGPRSEIIVELVRSPEGEPSIRIGGQCAIVARGEARI